jgi:D-alanyl-D-alanine carboxypeptidase
LKVRKVTVRKVTVRKVTVRKVTVRKAPYRRALIGVLGGALLLLPVATPAAAAATDTTAATAATNTTAATAATNTTAAAAATNTTATTAATNLAAATTGSIDGRQLQQLLDAEHAAGMPGVFAEVREGRQAWRGAAGLPDVDTGRPVRSWFRHRVGSITKTFVSTTLLQLVGEHRLHLDAPIGRYLPDVVPGELGQRVTVRMLLNHTSGIGNYTERLFRTAEDLERVRTRTFTPQELVAIGLAMPPTNAPGAGWHYSNTNYIIAGLLVERLTGHRVDAEVGRRILRPLGLRDTYFPGTDPHIRKEHSRAYVPWTDGKLRDFSEYNMSWAGRPVSWCPRRRISIASTGRC